MVKPLMDKPPALEENENGRVTLIRRYELITPLFGGGTEANLVDKTNPIRGTAVRGHLRFWWRATRGLKYAGDLRSLKAEEDSIWGSTSGGSKITIAVVESNAGKPYVVPEKASLKVGDPRSPLGYVAFPLNQHGEKVYEGVTFTLRIDLPKEYRPELKAALWAWETFGGLGARTRRGFGALHCTYVELSIDNKKYKTENWEWSYSCQNTADEIVADIEKFTTARDTDNDVPGLSRIASHTHCTPAKNDSHTAWRVLIDSLKHFRQKNRRMKNVNGQPRPFGRSYWPEPDAIRDLTGQSLKSRGHDRPVYGPPIYKFPRAAFGLPIVFEFKDDDDVNPSNPDADPRKTELKPADYERRASRLILRPLRCSDGRFVGLATILQGEIVPSGGLELKASPRNPSVGAENLTPGEATAISANHSTYNGKTDILQAFLDQLP